MQTAGWLTEHDFYDIQTAHREQLKDRKYQTKRSRNSSGCRCCYDYNYKRSEHAKKADMKIALRRDYWDDGFDMEGSEQEDEFADSDEQDATFGVEVLQESHSSHLETGEDDTCDRRGTTPEHEQSEQELEHEWDVVSNPSSDGWSVIAEE